MEKLRKRVTYVLEKYFHGNIVLTHIHPFKRIQFKDMPSVVISKLHFEAINCETQRGIFQFALYFVYFETDWRKKYLSEELVNRIQKVLHSAKIDLRKFIV